MKPFNAQEYLKQWRADNKRKIAINARSYRQVIRLKLLTFLGGVCAVCGFSDVRALHVDHINGGGSREVAGGRLYNRWSRFLSDPKPGLYQVLCANCNEIKRKSQMEQLRLY